ncbi:MAG: formyltetrahydrofolate deformylase [Bryobacterales bacterium]|nr:formyltetrahydrofolate deformylase [Bryobacterales bacterium]
MSHSATLLITCPDRKGLVARVSGLLYQHGASIIHADQHQDHEAGLFFMRVEWLLADFDVEAFRVIFAALASELNMNWRLEVSTIAARVAIFVSKQLHCLTDLLYRHRAGELHCEIPFVASNHPDAAALAEFHGVPFYYLAGTKTEVESRQTALLEEYRVDLVVLARYMQILSADLVA